MRREAISVINFSQSWKRKTFSCGTIHSIYQESSSLSRARASDSQIGNKLPFQKEPGEENKRNMVALFWFQVSMREISM